MTRDEEIIQASDEWTYQKPPQYSELVYNTHKTMCAYQIGFIDGAVWADLHPKENDKETHKFFVHGQSQMLAAICEHLRSQWGIGERDINQLKAIFSPYNDEAQYETALDDIMGEPMKDVQNLINTLHQ